MAAKAFKRIRFGLRTLLCVPLFVATVWWWTSWPERTAKRFVGLLNKGNVVAAQAMLVAQPVNPAVAEKDPVWPDIWDLAVQEDVSLIGSELRSRSISDVVGATGEFSISKGNLSNVQHLNLGGFAVVRGRIRPHSQQPPMPLSYYRIQTNADAILEHLRTASPPNAAMQICEAPDGLLLVRTSKQGHEELQDLLKDVDQPSHP